MCLWNRRRRRRAPHGQFKAEHGRGLRSGERPASPRTDLLGVREKLVCVATSLSAEQLRQQVRVRLAQGRLPAITVGIYKSRRGTGRLCLVCRHEIGSVQFEHEVDCAGVRLIAHEACYALWREESKARPSPRK
jgi:hypothetical protein